MTKRTEILELLSEKGILRSSDLADRDLSPEYLNLLAEEGLIERVARGVYVSPDYEATEHFDLVITQKRVPHGVFCLLTALQFHGMTTQIPSEVHLAVRRGRRAPELEWPPLNVFHISENQFEAGIEEHELPMGQTLRVYSAARTVVDCFKFRNQIGLDVALEALRAYWAQTTGSTDPVLDYAKICRVENIIRPYLEAII